MKHLIRKGIASALFVALGAVAYSFSRDGDFSRLIFLGLVFGFAGDIVIDVHYIIPAFKKYRLAMAAIAFLAGHGLYLTAVISRSNSFLPALIIGLIISGIVCLILNSLLIKDVPFWIVGVFYLVVVGVLAALSVNYYAEADSDNGRFLLCIGMVLFAVSDVLLIYRNYGKRHFKGMRAISLALYYSGQFLIAGSLFLS